MADDEVMGYTHKGTKWEFIQSWYLLALLTPWTYWFPLIYTGVRTLQFRWIFWGMFYGLPAFIRLKFDPADYGVEQYFKRWLFTVMVIGAIHALRARGEFLVRMVTAMDTREMLMEAARLRREMGKEPVSNNGVSGESGQPEGEEQQSGFPQAAPPVRRLFDINFIGERELAMMPGMGPERAKQAVAMRQTLGSFNSFDHFAGKIGLSADARERLRPIFIQPPPAFQTNDEYTMLPDGRKILEVNLASAQAIATLPGLNEEVARRAVALRDGDGWYRSLEDLRFRLGLSMDQMIQISPFVSTVRTSASRPGGKAGGRLVDASAGSNANAAAASKPSGRIVDL